MTISKSAYVSGAGIHRAGSRILYLDVPFENEIGGDKNRSRFLYRTLSEHFDVDIILMAPDGSSQDALWRDHQPVAIIEPRKPRFWRPETIPTFYKADHQGFMALLRRRRYSAIFSRFCTGWELCTLTARADPSRAVIVDVDMLASRLLGFSLARTPSFRQRWLLVQRLKLIVFERMLFRKPWLFLFSNANEVSIARAQGSPGNGAAFIELPNVMPRSVGRSLPAQEPIILYFGSMNSLANVDGFNFLLDEILPILGPQLRSIGACINIVGKNPPASFPDRLSRAGISYVKVIGAVPAIEHEIAQSLFVLLPIRIASGTRTRILEAAAQGRAVVTTPLGAEGLDLQENLLLSDTGVGLADHCRRLLENRTEAQRLGLKLQEQALRRYAPQTVGDQLWRQVATFIEQKK